MDIYFIFILFFFVINFVYTIYFTIFVVINKLNMKKNNKPLKIKPQSIFDNRYDGGGFIDLSKT